MVELRLKGGGEVPIAEGDTVAVGVVDIAGAGVRAMLAMRPPRAAALELELTGIPASVDREGEPDANVSRVCRQTVHR